MNRHLDGRLLTEEDFMDLAVKHGMVTRETWDRSDKLGPSKLKDMTRKVRFEMFMRGELALNTRTERNSP